MASDNRYFISFRNLVDDYPEIVTYATKEEMEEVLNRDYSDSSRAPEDSGSYDYYLKFQNNITDEFAVKYYASEKDMIKAVEIAERYGAVWEIYKYGRIIYEANS